MIPGSDHLGFRRDGDGPAARSPVGAGGTSAEWLRGHSGRPGRCLVLAFALVLAFVAVGCHPSRSLARLVLVAPNRVPAWVKPSGPVELTWPAGAWERIPARTNWVSDPVIPLVWRVIEPGDQGFSFVHSHRQERAHRVDQYRFRFSIAQAPALGGGLPRGTAFVLHGYGEDAESLFPWGVYLAQAGWRAVLVDVRGHGGSGGRKVSFGLWEADDLREFREQLVSASVVTGPTVAVGHSMGASLALRWQSRDPGVAAVVAFGPYARLGSTVVRMRDARARWVPRAWARGLGEEIPRLLGVEETALDPATVLRGRSPRALLVAGVDDAITPPSESFQLRPYLGPGSALLLVGPAAHEQLPYVLDQHGAFVLRWLEGVACGERGGGG